MTDKIIAVLGSTGSVGRQSLDVCLHHGLKVGALGAHSNIKLLEDQIRLFRPALCGVVDSAAARLLKTAVADTDTKIVDGPDAMKTIAGETESDTVVNAVTGFAGLFPSLAALEAGKDLALANKETLVAAGEIVMHTAKKNKAKILPVDSEHSAIFQCIGKNPKNQIKQILLTASGGPFFGMSRAELEGVTPERTLLHPTWTMGPKITVDSATLANKGLEVIEAVHLFGLPAERIRVLIHRQSIIHSMVEYIDNAVIAQLAAPDMRMCVQYALSYPSRVEGPVRELDFFELKALTFDKPDTGAFPLLALAYDAIYKGGVLPAVFNAANEEAVAAFLGHKISFNDISDRVASVVGDFKNIPAPSLSDISEADAAAREEFRRGQK